MRYKNLYVCNTKILKKIIKNNIIKISDVAYFEGPEETIIAEETLKVFEYRDILTNKKFLTYLSQYVKEGDRVVTEVRKITEEEKEKIKKIFNKR